MPNHSKLFSEAEGEKDCIPNHRYTICFEYVCKNILSYSFTVYVIEMFLL